MNKRIVGLAMFAVAGLVIGCGGDLATRNASTAPPPRQAGKSMEARLASPILPVMGMGSEPARIAPQSRDRFQEVTPATWQAVSEAPVSTFSTDVDTASYAVVRRSLREGTRPYPDMVRIEEMVNYFPYAYAGPKDKETGFKANVTLTPSPWKKGARLLHIGLKGWDAPAAGRPAANLTFLIDVSGSMEGADRLELVKGALKQLTDGLTPEDSVAIVTYSTLVETALEPTKASEKGRIIAAIDALIAKGGTAGGPGIQTAYRLAERNFDKNRLNRVILATDGDFNVGISDPRQLEAMIAAKRKTGIYLTVIGVGQGNLNDALMQRLAQTGNGQAAYFDSLLEARKVLIEEMASTLVPIADDVKVQVEFNPARVAEYRLVGYETRLLRTADFNDDAVDAAEIGSGHAVTAIYEYLPKGATGAMIDAPRYGAQKPAPDGKDDEIAFVKIRFKPPGAADSRLITQPVTDADVMASLDTASDDVRFGVAVAGYAQILRRQQDDGAWDATIALAEGARGKDPHGWRAEAVQLMRLARTLK